MDETPDKPDDERPSGARPVAGLRGCRDALIFLPILILACYVSFQYTWGFPVVLTFCGIGALAHRRWSHRHHGH